MESATLVPLSEYLHTSYHPDRDFLDGDLKERNTGEQPHARLQMWIGGIFLQHRETWDVRPLPEQRVQVTPTRFRIPDLCVLRRSDPRSPIVSVPPLLCIEILSSGDTLKELQERVDDYARMGIQHIWAVDPWSRRGYYASSRGFLQPEDGTLRIEGTPIAVNLAEVFAQLDEG